MSDAPDAVTIRDLHTLEDYAACCDLQEDIWGRGFSEKVPAAILRVSQKVGGVTAGAFDASGRMLGFVYGMTGIRHGELSHWSDMLAVRPEARGQHIGDRLKHFQREQVLALGVRQMLWTCDPLIARNAHFNINRLGARPVEYVENMYGITGSTLHGGMPTDRFVVAWHLTEGRESPPGADAEAAGDADLPLANPTDAAGMPAFADPGVARIVRVQVPADSESLPARDAAAALQWRLSVRAACTALFGRGFRVVRFVRATTRASHPYYVFSQD